MPGDLIYRVESVRHRYGDRVVLDIDRLEVTRGETTIATGAMTIACVSHRPGEPMKAVAIPVSFASRFQVATP